MARSKATDFMLDVVAWLAIIVMLGSLTFGATGLVVGLYVVLREYVLWW